MRRAALPHFNRTSTRAIDARADERRDALHRRIALVFLARPEEAAQAVPLLALDDVHMEGRNALAHAVVHGDEGAVRAERRLEGARDALHVGEERRDRGGRQVGERLDVHPRDDEHVPRKERLYVQKSHARVALEDARGGARPAHDFAEEAARSHSPPPLYQWRALRYALGMRFQALACDYDGTLATHGTVDASTLAALQRFVASGRTLLLVTGRELHDLEEAFPHLHLFTRIVAENGALLYHPATHEQRRLADPPPPELAEALRRAGAPVSVGEVIVATVTPHEVAALEIIKELGLEHHVIFNKGAVMILPSGVNKRTGLEAALADLGLSLHNTAGIGDAENDHAFLEACECGVATANALPALKERVDLVTPSTHGAGVAELVERILEDDLRSVDAVRTRHRVLLGTDANGDVHLDAHGVNLLVAGPSGSGKSTAVSAILERLFEQRYQVCLVDPEGDYDRFEGTVSIGNPTRAPSADETLQLLARADVNAVVNLLGQPLDLRPRFFGELFPRLQDLRVKTGRPHWIAIDEAHHLLPASWEPASLALPQRLGETILVTVHPAQVAPAILATIDVVIAVGARPEETFATFARAIGEQAPRGMGEAELETGEVLVWWRREGRVARVRVTPARAERMRHVRKYAQGELGDHSFYFRGPQGKLNLRAQNLVLFSQIAEGIDDETWMHHLRAGDYARWFRDKIKDPELAAEAAAVQAETERGLAATESRGRIRAAIERRYSLPAEHV